MPETDGQKIRTDRAILEEILEILRNQERRQSGKTEELPLSSADYAIRHSQIFSAVDILKTWVRLRGQAILLSKKAGILRYMRFDKEQGSDVLDDSIAIRNRDGEWVVTISNAKIAIVDKSGREFEKYSVGYGDRIKFQNGSSVVPWQEIVERDPYSIPILTEVAGKVAFGDIIKDVSVREEIDEVTGLSHKVVLVSSSHLRPRISIKDTKGTTTLARYLLPVGTYILVEKGDIVFPGDVLGKILIATLNTLNA
ncbi:MAG: hypothetical protein A2Z50_07040 [Nitrospirae bacterium RBG_19FT_COMBO_42_15]|nr:MAG: hypothetical protein A2Z50_07040 [Nitrospirae bacterium RBG_19FT_COMBO_42_15]